MPFVVIFYSVVALLNCSWEMSLLGRHLNLCGTQMECNYNVSEHVRSIHQHLFLLLPIPTYSGKYHDRIILEQRINCLRLYHYSSQKIYPCNCVQRKTFKQKLVNTVLHKIHTHNSEMHYKASRLPSKLVLPLNILNRVTFHCIKRRIFF